MAHIRMKQDHTMDDSLGNTVALKRGEVIDHEESTLSEDQVKALVGSGLASSSLDDYHILFRGNFEENVDYFSGEFVNSEGTQWEFLEDYKGLWDSTRLQGAGIIKTSVVGQ